MVKNTYIIYRLQPQHLKPTLPTSPRIYDLAVAQKLINGICISLFANFIGWTIWKCKFIGVRKSHCSHFTTINVVKIMALTFLLVLRNSFLCFFFMNNSLFFSKALISLPCPCGKTICLSFLLVLMSHGRVRVSTTAQSMPVMAASLQSSLPLFLLSQG